MHPLFSRRWWILLLALAGGGSLCAQDAELREHADHQLLIGAQPVRGKFYYVIEDLRAGLVVQRGVSETQSDLHSRLLLPANRRFREGILHARTLKAGFSEFTTPPAGQRFRLPSTTFLSGTEDDADGDELSDLAEFIVGTDPRKADTDGDGVLDGVEIQQDTSPLDNAPLATGLLAVAPVQGVAVDVDALDGWVAVAAGEAGVAVFDVGLGFTPALQRQVATPSPARRVAMGDEVVVTALGQSGVGVLDLQDTGALRLLPLGESRRETVTAIASAGVLAVAGTAEGSVWVMHPRLETTLQREAVNGPVQDLKVAGDLLLVVTGQGGAFSPRTLHVFQWAGSEITLASRLPLGAFGPEGLTGSSRVTGGAGVAYVTAFVGFDVIDVSNPSAPQIRAAARDLNPNSFKQVAPNGSGLGIAAVGINPGAQAGHDLWIYDLRDPTVNTAVRAVLPMPDRVRAVALYQGLAYAAASAAGLLVVNYESPDSRQTPPSLRLETSFPVEGSRGRAEENKLERVTAVVTDDVQVRQVRFFLDGVPLGVDGAFPFEVRLVTPSRSEGRREFALRAEAVDTGGNRAESAPLVVDLVPDSTPPRLAARFPAPGKLTFGDLREIGAGFNEPLLLSDWFPERFEVLQADSTGSFEPGKGKLIRGGELVMRDEGRLALRLLGDPLPTGRYQVTLPAPVRDGAGNSLTQAVVWGFSVLRPDDLAGTDTDGDGLADVMEIVLGLNPAQGGDGDRDLDGDGLGTRQELLLGLDPTQADSDVDGLADAGEDRDQDGLTNLREVQLGTDPLLIDTDGDRWPDEGEVTAGSDPRQASSTPRLLFSGTPAVEVLLPVAERPPGLPLGTVFSRPTVGVLLPGIDFGAVASFGPVIARPPVAIIAPAGLEMEGLEFGPFVARPQVDALLPAMPPTGGDPLKSHLARPPITVEILSR